MTDLEQLQLEVKKQLRLDVMIELGMGDVELHPIRRRLRGLGYVVTRNEVNEIRDGTFNIWDFNNEELHRWRNVATMDELELAVTQLEAADPQPRPKAEV